MFVKVVVPSFLLLPRASCQRSIDLISLHQTPGRAPMIYEVNAVSKCGCLSTVKSWCFKTGEVIIRGRLMAEAVQRLVKKCKRSLDFGMQTRSQ
jgi:hypothetical protein